MSFKHAEVYARFAYHQPSTQEVRENHEAVRLECGELAAKLIEICPESRELSLALTNLDQVCMWANAAVARHQ